MKKITLTCVMALVAVVSAQAQNLTARSSTQNYTYVFGAGGNVNNDTYLEEDFVLEASDGMSHSYSDSTSGTLPGGVQYTAGVGIQMSQAYSVIGSLTNFSQIIAESSSSAYTETVNGSAQVLSANPGNGLVLNFDLANQVDYRFRGSILSSPSEVGIGNLVALQRYDGITWQQVHTTIFLPGQQGSFDYTGTLNSGQYRLLSSNAVTISGNNAVSSDYSYNFEVVPEPVTMFALAPALMFLARKRKK